MSDMTCPGCHTNKYSNPSLKLLVNVCGHFLCDNCVDILFIRGSGSCPQCKVALRRNNFRSQLFEDSSVEKEVNIRKKVIKDFNKREEDFPSLQKYNDYLETVENIIFNLSNDIDVEETKKSIEEYKLENKDSIKRNRVKKNPELALLENLIALEETSRLELTEAKREEAIWELRQRQEKEELIDDLMTSSAPAAKILAQHKAAAELAVAKSNQLSTAAPTATSAAKYTSFAERVKASGSEVCLQPSSASSSNTATNGTQPEAAGKRSVPQPFHHTPLQPELQGPMQPTGESIARHTGLVDFTLAVGLDSQATTAAFQAGFTRQLWCDKLLHEAYSGLFYDLAV